MSKKTGCGILRVEYNHFSVVKSTLLCVHVIIFYKHLIMCVTIIYVNNNQKIF